MGCYDYFGEQMIQLKIGPCEMNHYKVGDKIRYTINGECVKHYDGVYVGYAGVVVIVDGMVVATSSELYDKWGRRIDLSKLMNELNPLTKVVEDVRKECEENKKVDKDVKKLVKKAAKTVKKEIEEAPEGNRYMPLKKWEHKGRMPKSELKKGKKCTKKT